MSKKRLKPDDRKEAILAAALDVAERVGFPNLTRENVAEAAGVERSLVSYYFGTMAQFKRAVMRAAVSRGRARIVAQGLALGNEHARKASPELMELARGCL